ncbi:hypothetical protein BMF94_6520 [Rhodotorula taiwanensis]|uniref:Sugar phosphate transporter domain-containing protein n=1 Tax=Rhodotorula taiwanensis TaxID=741276 RepID=A0A2S5B0Z0_9BASI|nr:hypothetical protein BMF94_6520 [Rhodotorula taiwanensis]
MASQQALTLYDTPRASIDGKRQSDARWPSTSHSPSMSRQPSSANLEHKRAGQAPTRHAATSWTAHRRATPLLVLGWIGLSSAVILNNRHILIDRSFDYPITLTTIHLVFQTVATQVLHRFTELISGPVPDQSYRPLPSSDSTELAELAIKEEDAEGVSASTMSPEEWKRRSVEMDLQTWVRRILPVAILFSLSLVLSNWAYLYCSVAFIHILKSFAPVAILLAAFAFRTKTFSFLLLGIVAVISFGVGMASYGQVDFARIGFTIQMTAIAIEATRVTLIQILLTPPAAPQPGEPAPAPLAPALATGMSPLKSLYFFAPAGLAVNLVFLVAVEGMPAVRAIPQLGLLTILGNASLTFALNLSSIMLIGISAMVMGLAKIFKDVLMVVLPVFFLGENLSGLQYVGYSIATAGLVAYKFYG